MRDDRSAYDPPSMREHRRETRSGRTTAIVLGAILTVALAVTVVVSVTAASHWQALGR